MLVALGKPILYGENGGSVSDPVLLIKSHINKVHGVSLGAMCETITCLYVEWKNMSIEM